MKKKRLSQKQEKFCNEHIKNGNGKRSAISAGYSARTATTQASDLLTRPHIKARIEALISKSTYNASIKNEEILKAIKELALLDPISAFDDYCNLLPFKEWPPEVRRCVASFKSVKMYAGKGSKRKAVGEVVEVKFWSKPMALDMLMKYLGNYNRDMSGREINLTNIQINHNDIPVKPEPVGIGDEPRSVLLGGNPGGSLSRSPGSSED